jgi:hypothetical protein
VKTIDGKNYFRPYTDYDAALLLVLARKLIILPPYLPIKINTITPITGIMIVSGGHRPSVNMGVNTSNSFITVTLRSSKKSRYQSLHS